MKHHLYKACAVALAMLIAFNVQAQKKPDFAFPQQVERQSKKALEGALHAADGPAALRALIDMVLARDAVDGTVANQTLALVDSVCSVTRDAATLSMLRLVKAELLLSVYNRQSWVYNQRKLPLTPVPDDVLQWSGDQFRSAIYTLCDEASADVNALRAQPLHRWSGVVRIERQSLPLYPTLLEFVCRKAVDIVRDCRVSAQWIPFRLQCPWRQFVNEPIPTAVNPAVKVLVSVFERWIKADQGTAAPLIEADLTRINTLLSNSDPKVCLASLKELYETTKENEWSGMVLLAMDDFRGSNDSTFYAEVKQNISKFPAFIQRANLESILARAYAARLHVSAPGLTVPGDTFSLDVQRENLATGRIDIYKVVTSESPWVPWINPEKAEYQHVNTIPVGGNVGEWPTNDTISLTAVLKNPGRYALVPSVSNVAVAPGEANAQILFNSSIALIEHGTNRGVITAVSTLDGKPVANVEILDTDSRVLGSTDAAGNFKCQDTQRGNVWGRLGENVTTSLYIGSYPQPDARATIEGRVYTSLPLYRPGDLMEWAAALFVREGKNLRIAAEMPVVSVVNDANGKTIKTDTLTTDAWGRVTSKMRIPKTGLQGDFRIKISARDGLRGQARGSFTVSDYKLPTFEVVLDSNASKATGVGGYILVAEAKAYSGFPIAGAKLTGTVGVESYFGDSAEFADVNAVSQSDGKITVDIPADVFRDSPIQSKNYYLQATITSPSGENVVERWPLNIGTDWLFSFDTRPIKVEDGIVRLPLICTQGGMQASVDFKYTFFDGDSHVLSGTASTANPVVKVGDLPSGRYAVELFPVSSKDVFVGTTKGDVVIYRDTDTVPPIPSVLWMAESGTMNINGRNVDVRVGVSHPTHLLIQTATEDGVAFRVEPVDVGMHLLNLTIPMDASSATVQIAAMAKGQFASRQLVLVDTTAQAALKFEVESFRDKATSGSREVWKLRLRNINSPQGESAVMLDMFNTSILDVAPGFNWGAAPGRAYRAPVIWLFNQPSPVSAWGEAPIKNFKTVSLDVPDFLTWGMGFGGNRHYYKMASRAVNGAAEVMVEETAVQMDAGLVSSAAAKAVSDYAGMTEDAKDEDFADGQDVQPQGNQQYRDAEVALGLFRPMLVTEPDGSLSVTLTLPDANSRWRVLGTAYNQSLMSATWLGEVVTSKPVMVQPNLPRFLRKGDKAELEALIMNNTDQTQSITTAVELYNAETNAVIDSVVTHSSLSGNTSTTVRVTYDVPVTAGALIGYRIKASTRDFSDGEQSLIPILDAATRVVESRPFCIPADSTQFTVMIPEGWNPDNTVLEYCNSPVWTVVSALPGLMQGTANTATQAAQTVFAAATAQDILRKNPQIATALKQWTRSDRQDSTLVSMLARNDALKTMVLSDTPWVSDAESQTERMTRLALLLDEDAVAAAIMQGVTTLKNLSSDGGGWRWMAGSSSRSQWATNYVLQILGTLNAQGIMPNDKELTATVKRALAWTDDTAVKEYEKYPNGNYTEYVYTRLLFPELPPSYKADAVISSTVQNLTGRWKDQSILSKAMAAQILYRRNYVNIAKEILASLDEYAYTGTQQGMYWPALCANRAGASFANTATATLLDTYAMVEPDASQLPLIAQWLILQKQGQDWGVSSATTQVVSSIIRVAGESVVPSQQVHVTSSGTELATPEVNIPGYFTMNLSGASKQIAVKRGVSRSSAFGSLIYSAVQPFDSIKAAATPTLSINKELYVKRGMQMQIVKPGDALAVGDQVTVQLTVTCKQAVDYVAITDQRAACLAPVEQLPGYTWVDGIGLYRQVSNATTSFFVDSLPEGVYQLSFQTTVDRPGEYITGIATVQSQYAPAATAHTAATKLTVK